jgi:hypothetical protein
VAQQRLDLLEFPTFSPLRCVESTATVVEFSSLEKVYYFGLVSATLTAAMFVTEQSLDLLKSYTFSPLKELESCGDLSRCLFDSLIRRFTTTTVF